jgi:acyl carrier protein
MDKLSAYPDALRDLVLAFRESPDADKADRIVLAILRYHQADAFEGVYAAKGEASVLVDDLGLDSLTMTEIAFEAEDFLDISISNEDMLRIKCIADLKQYVRRSIF